MKKIIVLVFLFSAALVFSTMKVNGMEVSSTDLKKGFFYESKSNIAEESFEYTIKKICKHDEGFIVVGDTRDTEEIAFHVEFFVTYPYIAYYNDDGLVWSYVDKQIGYGNYMDAVVVNNEVVAIGSYETGDGTSKLLLTRFNQFGNVKSRVEFDADKSTFGYRILYDNKKFYLLGTTNATHFLKDAEDVINKIFVLKLNSTFQQENIVFINNSGLSNFKDACIYNGQIYIHCALSGTGEYDISGPDYLLLDSLVAIDSNFKYIDHTTVIRNKYMKIACNDDGLYLFLTNGDLDTFQINEYDVHLRKQGVSYPYKNEHGLVNSIAVSSSSLDEPVSCYIGIENGSHYFVGYMSINLRLDIINCVTREMQIEMSADGAFILDGYYYLFSNLSTSREVDKLAYIKEKDGFVYANGIRCQSETEPITSTVFGTYKRKTTHYFGDVEFYSYSDYVISPKISIRDKGVYDRCVKLEFNGTGYLNNELIDSGYVVREEGLYILEVQGKDQTMFLYFEVKRLAIIENSFDVEDTTAIYNKTIGVISSSSSSSSYERPLTGLSLDNFKEEENDKKYLVVACVGVGLLLGVLLPLERLIKKNGEMNHE